MERRRYRRLYDGLLSRVYDLYMAWYLLPFGGERRFRRRMLEGLVFRPGERILDATCGTGSCAIALLERTAGGASLVASDLSRGQLRIARAKRRLAGVPLVVADASGLPFRDASFDSVFLPHAIHEMPRALRLAVLRDARRVCAAGGRVVVLELDRPPRRLVRWLLGLWFFYWVPFNFETRTRRDLERRTVLAEVEEAGFEDVRKRSRYAGTFQVVEGQAGSGLE
jgi:demethylmenaquinone methyltransferase/2-methoxy-6-polyprenyl-1,4-benzoquinol methylase